MSVQLHSHASTISLEVLKPTSRAIMILDPVMLVLRLLAHTTFCLIGILMICRILLENSAIKIILALPKLWHLATTFSWEHPWGWLLLAGVIVGSSISMLMLPVVFSFEKEVIRECRLRLALLWYQLNKRSFPSEQVLKHLSFREIHLANEELHYTFSLSTEARPYLRVVEAPTNMVHTINQEPASFIITEEPSSATHQLSVDEIPEKPIQTHHASTIWSQPRVHICFFENGTARIIDAAGGETVLTIPLGCFQLFLYITSHTRNGEWVTTQDTLRDVYHLNDKTEEEKEKRIKALFHTHCRRLRTCLQATKQAIGWNKPDFFQKRKQGGEYEWRLAEWCTIDDLPLLDECAQLLSAEKKGEAIEPCRLKEACEKVYAVYTGDFLARQRALGQLGTDGWIKKNFQTFLTTYLKALTFLADDAHKSWMSASDSEGRQDLQWKEARLRAEYAICCARTLFEFVNEKQELYRKQGERRLCQSLEVYALISDLSAATEAHQFYTTCSTLMKELDNAWKPSPQLVQALEQVMVIVQSEVNEK